MVHLGRDLSIFRLILLGILFLSGLAVSIDGLSILLGGRSLVGLYPAMSALSGLCFILGSMATFYLYDDRPKRVFGRSMGLAFSACLTMVGSGQIIFYAFKAWNGHFDEALNLTLGRIGLTTPISSFNFFILGMALFVAFIPRRTFQMISQFTALVVVFLSLLALMTFVYRAQQGGSSIRFTSSALPTALGTLTLGVFAVLSTREVGLSRLIFKESLGGRLVRRLIPSILAVQVIFEWLRSRSDLSQTYEEPIGMQLLAISNSLILLAVITFIAASLDQLDAARREAHEALQKLNGELEDRVKQRTRELEIANGVLSTQFSERQVLEHEFSQVRERVAERLGRIIHDGLSQELIGLTFNLKAFQHRLKPLDGGAAEEATRLEEQARGLVGQVRNISRQVYPPELGVSSLMVSLQELVRHHDGKRTCRCLFECEEPVSLPDREMETHLYYIAQEALENAIRHSGGTTVWVRLAHDENVVLLEVEDNGSGDMAVKADPGIGNRIMHYRSRMVGGDLVVRRQKGVGTKISCRIPLPIEDKTPLSPRSLS